MLMEKVARMGTMLGGFMMFAAAALVCLELLLRNLFNISIGGADEISSYLFAVSVAWALPHVILTNAMIRIDALVGLVPAAAGQVLLRLGTFLLAAFIAILAGRAVQMAWLSFDTGSRAVTPLQTPLAVPQSLWALGLVTAALVGLLQVFRHHALAIDDEIAAVKPTSDS
jgi:TRAP-type C4-dicarboxylate transport system permease small subunit